MAGAGEEVGLRPLGFSYHVLNEKIDTSPGASELWFDPRRARRKHFSKRLQILRQSPVILEIDKSAVALWGHSGGGILVGRDDHITSGSRHRGMDAFRSALMFLSHPELRGLMFPPRSTKFR